LCQVRWKNRYLRVLHIGQDLWRKTSS
jgi:hypothetical protein